MLDLKSGLVDDHEIDCADLATNAGVTTIITLSSQPYYIIDIVAHIQAHADTLSVENQRLALQKDIQQVKFHCIQDFEQAPRYINQI